MAANPAAVAEVASSGPQVRTARLAVATMFFVNGAALANWVALVPYVQDHLRLQPAVFGLALLGATAGSLIAMPLAGASIPRLGSRILTVTGALLFCVALPLPILAPNAALLFLALAAFGAGNGLLDVSMNAHGVEVERRHGRPIMSSFHGLFSVGGLVGATASGLLVAAGIAPLPHVIIAGLALGLLVLATARFLLPSAVDRVAAPAQAAIVEKASPLAVLRRLSGPLLALGVVGFCGHVGEGSMADWSAIYLHRSLATTAAFASAGYAVFSLTMASGRLGGDWLTARLGPPRIVRLGGAVAAIGMALALIAGQPLAAVVGFGLVGFGLANVVPNLLSAAGRTAGVAPGAAIATVTTASYCGFLAGPPLIGFAAQLTSLRWGLGIVALFCAVIAVLGGAVKRAA